MTVLDVIQRSAEFLARKGVDSPRLQVELLLASVLKMPRLRLYLDFERKLSDAELEQTRQLVKRRGNREPLQHILGNTSFCGLDILVTPDVLIPRPETELLAERAWEWLNRRGETAQESPGCIGLWVGKRLHCAGLGKACPIPLSGRPGCVPGNTASGAGECDAVGAGRPRSVSGGRQLGCD